MEKTEHCEECKGLIWDGNEYYWWDDCFRCRMRALFMGWKKPTEEDLALLEEKYPD